MKVALLIAMLILLCSFSSKPTKLEETFNTQEVELLNQLTSGYNKTGVRIYVNDMNFTHPVFIDPDGITYTVVVKNNSITLISTEEFYNLFAAK